MKWFRLWVSGLLISGFVLLGAVQAQWGDPMASVEAIMQQQDQAMLELQQYNMQMEAYMNEQMRLAQQRVDNAWMQQLQFWADYYVQNTGDRSLSFDEAARRGDILWCQHNPVQCQQNIAQTQEMTRISQQGHQQRMNDIAAWGQTSLQIGQINSDILDMNHKGYMERSAVQDQGQANYVQGAVWGESTFVNASGVGFSLPVYPDPSMAYSTPEGYQLGFNYNTDTWYQADGYGGWVQLQQQR